MRTHIQTFPGEGPHPENAPRLAGRQGSSWCALILAMGLAPSVQAEAPPAQTMAPSAATEARLQQYEERLQQLESRLAATQAHPECAIA